MIKNQCLPLDSIIIIIIIKIKIIIIIIIIIIIKRRSTAGKTTWFESKYFRSILIRLYREYSMT